MERIKHEIEDTRLWQQLYLKNFGKQSDYFRGKREALTRYINGKSLNDIQEFIDTWSNAKINPNDLYFQGIFNGYKFVCENQA